MSFELIGVDKQIYEYIESQNSFLLFAGAGSGKTRTLVNLLQAIRSNKKQHMLKRGQKVAVITYTNSACDEIKERIKYDSLFEVSTIHSLTWELIKPFTEDIRSWRRNKLIEDIKKLDNKISRAKNQDTRNRYEHKRFSKETKLNDLKMVNEFIYSPNELLFGKGALNHTDVIQVCTHFLQNYELMRKILVNQYPIIFIDECQDTQKDLLRAIIYTQEQLPEQLTIGLFGDLMQRIYSDGYSDIIENLPSNWETPIKTENYRCPNRVRHLINKIRMLSDGLQQTEPNDKAMHEGIARIFITSEDISKITTYEASVKQQMYGISNDENWLSDVQTLVLEHKMSAKRGDFLDFFEPLSRVTSTKDNLLQGKGESINFLTEILQPFINAIYEDDDFAIMRILEANCTRISDNNSFTLDVLNQVKTNLEDFSSSIDIQTQTIKEILIFLNKYDLLEINQKLLECINLLGDEEDLSDSLVAWNGAIEAPYKQLTNYIQYINNKLGFITHQSVKGLEYPRVLAILNDSESNGFLFKFEKMLEAVPLSNTDLRNQREGKETVLDRTRRLFYVICSRARESLAIVVYSQNPQAVKRYVIENDWFTEEEVILG